MAAHSVTAHLNRWAATVAALLRPGGSRVYLVEFHPVLTALGLSPLSRPRMHPVDLRPAGHPLIRR
jgi:hypothetical protein